VDGRGEEFDLIVCATGYYVSFPFLPPGLVPVKGSVAKLYGGCVLAEYKNLYIIGTIANCATDSGPWLRREWT